jgi:16S rRNA (cytosine1402-N4)-methyltransferase
MLSELPDLPPEQLHKSVMPAEAVELMQLKPGDICLDATLGMGGHSAHFVERIRPGGVLIGLDRDVQAIEIARKRLQSFDPDPRIILRHLEFSRIGELLSELGDGEPLKINAGMIDAGTSSFQMDYAPGFSFQRNDPLDGRMNRTGSEETIADLIARASEQELAAILWELGDERYARRIARGIHQFKQQQGPITTTGQLVQIVERSVPRAEWPRDKHVATKTMQALRVAVNDELNQLAAGVNAILNALVPGGRLVFIGFQGQECKVVKDIFARRSGRVPAPSGMSIAALAPTSSEIEPDIRVITRKPVLPTETEVAMNPRARSASLRCAEKLGTRG